MPEETRDGGRVQTLRVFPSQWHPTGRKRKISVTCPVQLSSPISLSLTSLMVQATLGRVSTPKRSNYLRSGAVRTEDSRNANVLALNYISKMEFGLSCMNGMRKRLYWQPGASVAGWRGWGAWRTRCCPRTKRTTIQLWMGWLKGASTAKHPNPSGQGFILVGHCNQSSPRCCSFGGLGGTLQDHWHTWMPMLSSHGNVYCISLLPGKDAALTSERTGVGRLVESEQV